MPGTALLNPLTNVLFEQASDFVGLYDLAAGWFTRVNPAGVRLLGYPSAQALYDDPNRMLRARRTTPAEWEALLDEVTRAGHYEVEEVELRRYLGETFWAKIDLHSFTIDSRHYLLVRLIDVNRLHEAELNLAQSVRRFEAVFAHATIGIIVGNQAGNIVLANRKAQELFGYAESELLAQRIEALVPDAARPHHEHLRASFNGHPQVRAMGANRDLQARHRDGSVFPVEISLSFFHFAAELYVVAYIIDITFKKEADRALQAEREHVERLNADLEQQVADRTQALQATLAQLEKRTAELTSALDVQSQRVMV